MAHHRYYLMSRNVTVRFKSMAKVVGLKTLRLISNNIQKSKLFYQSLFEITPIESQEKFVSFLIGDHTFDICLEDEKNPTSTGGSIFYWEVDELDLFLTKAEKLGAKLFRGPLKVKETNSRIVQIKDPAGSIFGLEELL